MKKYLISELATERAEGCAERDARYGFSISRGSLNGKKVSSVRVPREYTFTDKQRLLASMAVSEELKQLIPSEIMSSNTPVTVICLGNASLTADSLGPLCAKKIAATRALRLENPNAFRSLGGREITVITPGVSGHTGIEALELLRACKPLLKTELVIAIDSLKAIRRESLSSVIQLSTDGIIPGSAIGNSRLKISSEALGIPVISIGAPTAISSGALICDALMRAGITSMIEPVSEILKNEADFTVSANDLDIDVRRNAEIIAKAINLTLLGFAEA